MNPHVHPVALIVLCLLLAAPVFAQTHEPDADTRLRNLYETEFAWRQGELKQVRTGDGHWRAGAGLPRVDAESQAGRLAYWDQTLAELARIPREKLSTDEQINAAVFQQIITSLADNARYRTWEAPLNSDTFFWSGLHPRMGGFDSEQAYEDYVDRLRDLPRFFGEQQSNMRAGLGRGYSVPRITLEGREQSLEPYLAPAEQNPFWGPVAAMPESIPAASRTRLQSAVKAAIAEAVVPAYRTLLTFMREEYLPHTRQTLSARDLPDGPAFYQAMIRSYTTLDMTPEQIHAVGLEEVTRIRTEMRQTKAETGFEGDMPAFLEFLRTDPQFYAQTPHELLAFTAYVAKRVDGQLGATLGFLPRQRFTILPVPDAIAPFYTGGRGGLESCLFNTHDLPSRPLYTLTALTLHECAPGHALQAAIALEGPGAIPEFRANNYFSGYGEGWGLYTEWLGVEMGVYDTPYEHFGRLSYEMWRAARLVIDTGLHHYGWSRERAQAFLREHTALSEHELTTEIDRYISWPGQALAYKLGEMLIRRKRREAEAALAQDFDKRHFHDLILGLRSVPLPVLEAQLDAWIEAGGPNPYPKAASGG
ncbi:DUF885 domain-containing protein [Kineobactrum sediminis]|uniref:DUF885 domain-containing protein n=1 Tax=Kineobactrum sediminis TaxID=1905677 RepID=A0A2N5XZN1_9GAMM|nr:DUF885 family protein [Kineobactrum sediminis]PLW81583.1 DUF885 domain-containing protein [Kineobactrum sediminis]